MISSYWTFSRTRTFWKLIFCILTHIISITLPFMTRLTKMSISPTEPLSSWATKFTFELNEIFSMLWTVFNWNLTAIRTDQFLFLIICCIRSFIHCICTILSSAKVRFFTFKTHKVGINSHRIFSWLFEVRWFSIFQLLIFITLLKLKSV